MPSYHAVCWLDHSEARIFFISRDKAEEFDITSSKPHTHLHHRAGSLSGQRLPDDHAFFHSIVEALKPAHEWLIMGPSRAKLELVKHIHKHDHTLSDRVVGVETADHPTDKQIVAHARAYFHEQAPRIKQS